MDYGKKDPSCSGTDVSECTNRVGEWIPGFGVDYNFSRGFNVFGSVHKGFAPPGSKEEIPSEVRINYEVGGRYRNRFVGAEGVVFFNGYTNLLSVNLVAVGGDGSQDQFNNGAVHTVGIEASLGYDLGLLISQNVSFPLNIKCT